MARKNMLANLTGDTETPHQPSAQPRNTNTIAGIGAAGSISRTFSDVSQKAEQLEKLQEILRSAKNILELDPAILDPSPYSDRMENPESDERYKELREAIRERGQDTPVLIRTNPNDLQRYQIIFGHRRTQAAKDLGRLVKAVVTNLSDRELAQAQGQENTARSDLSFIEKSRFAARLHQEGFSRETICSALTTDKHTLSRMLTVLEKMPVDIIEAIGPARKIGRPRWIKIASMWSSESVESTKNIIQSQRFKDMGSDERFEAIYRLTDPKLKNAVHTKVEKSKISLTDGHDIATISETESSLTIKIDKSHDKDFAKYLSENIEEIYFKYQEDMKGSSIDTKDP